MSSLTSPYAVSILGKPLAPAPVPQLRAEGAPMSRAQLDMARWAFGRFMDQARLSFAPNPSQHGFLPDGSRFRIMSVAGAQIMQVWPVQITEGRLHKYEVDSGIVLRSLDPAAHATFYVLSYRDGEWSGEVSEAGYCALSVVHRKDSEGRNVHFVMNWGTHRRSGGFNDSVVHYSKDGAEYRNYNNGGGVAWQFEVFRASSITPSEIPVNFSRGSNTLLRLSAGMQSGALDVSIYKSTLPAIYKRASNISEHVPKEIDSNPARGHYQLDGNGWGWSQNIGLHKSGGFILSATRILLDTPILGGEDDEAVKDTLYSVINSLRYFYDVPYYYIDIRPNFFYKNPVDVSIHYVRPGQSIGPDGVQAIEHIQSVIDNRHSNRRRMHKGYSRLMDFVTHTNTTTKWLSGVIDLRVNYNSPTCGWMFGEGKADYIEIKKTTHGACGYFDDYLEYEDVISDCTLLSRYTDANGECFDVYLHTEVHIKNTIDANRMYIYEGTKLPRDKESEGTGLSVVRYHSYENAFAIMGTVDNELGGSFETTKSYEFPDKRSFMSVTTCSKSTLKFIHRDSPTESVNLAQVISMGGGVEIYKSEAGTYLDMNVPLSQSADGRFTSMWQLGFHPQSSIICFIEISAKSIGHNVPYGPTGYPIADAVDCVCEYGVSFVVYKNNHRIYDKVIFSGVEGNIRLPVRVLEYPWEVDVHNPGLDKTTETREYIGDIASEGYIVRSVWSSCAENDKGKATYGGTYEEEYDDPGLSAPIRSWDFEDGGDFGGRPGIPIRPERLLPDLSTFLDISKKESLMTQIHFGLDANSGGVSIVCKHAEILIAPDNSVTEIKDVKNADGEILVPYGIDMWCAST